jgi:fused signal recognition particle receptor
VTILAIVIAIVVVLVVSGALFVRTRGGRQTPESLAPPTAEVPTAETIEAQPDLTTAPPETEAPAPAAGRMVRLRARLARSESTLGKGLLSLLSRDTLDDATWDEVEDLLLTADVGVTATTELVDSLRRQAKVLGTHSQDDARRLLHDGLLDLVNPKLDRSLATVRADGSGPAVVLVVGVNGTGKTTTVGKMARLLVAEGRHVVLGAADTFRAAAADQLETWGRRVGATTVRGPEGGDPASVAFDAVKTGAEMEADTVLVDTAGRLHTKSGLMDELGKVKRVVEKHGPVDETLLVLDATTGQNGLVQARVFAEVVAITGVVLTKLDGTAKGGIVISVQRELGVPVKLVGLGEGPDDLAPFEPEAFVDALLGD